MDSKEHRNEVVRAYQDATHELRRRHDDEFHSILADIYAERNIVVRKRRSRQQALKHRVQKALEIVSANNAG